MNKMNPATLKRLRETYPPGTRVELDHMDDPYNRKLTTGSRGTVVAVDDIGTIHVAWDCGSSLGVCYGEDACHVVKEEISFDRTTVVSQKVKKREQIR